MKEKPRWSVTVIFEESNRPALEEILLINPYMEKDAPYEKQSILDIRARTVTGELINVEMQLFNKGNMAKRTLFYWGKQYTSQMEEGGLVNWLLFLKGSTLLNWEVLAMNEPKLKKAMTTLEFLSQDREARQIYEDRQKFLWDQASALHYAETTGREKGLQEGRQEGRGEGKEEVARNLLRMGMDMNTIQQATGLTLAEIERLR